MRIRSISGLVAVLSVFLLGTPAWATTVTLSFDNISANNVADANTGEAQLFVDVTDMATTVNGQTITPGSDQVLFVFHNTGPNASSITDVYFDDGSLLSIATIIDDPANVTNPVDFLNMGVSPPNLPAANQASPPFVTTAGFSADSQPPAQPNGVNPGEELGILFNLQSGQTFDDVLAQLQTGQLRIGIHVQGFTGGGSESFVNNPPGVIPEPSSLAIAGLGLLGLVYRSRRKKS